MFETINRAGLLSLAMQLKALAMANTDSPSCVIPMRVSSSSDVQYLKFMVKVKVMKLIRIV